MKLREWVEHIDNARISGRLNSGWETWMQMRDRLQLCVDALEEASNAIQFRGDGCVGKRRREALKKIREALADVEEPS